MSRRSKSALVGTAGMLLAALPGLAAPFPTLMPEDALIQNSGSTNTSGYTIYVTPSGAVQYARAGGVMSSEVHFDTASLPKARARKLFQDLAAALPLSSLPARHGMRSASFGTKTYVTYKGQRSPNLALPGNDAARALHDDIGTISKALNLGGPRRPALMRRPMVLHLNSTNKL